MTKYTFFICLIFLYSSCYEDVDQSTQTEIPHQAETNVDSKALIKLNDASGNTISNYVLNVNDNIVSVSTDFYYGPLEKISDKNQLLLFKKDEQIISIANSSFFLNETSYIDSEIFPTYTKTSENTIDISQVTDSNIGTFDFNSTLFEDDQGTSYSGDIQISTLGISSKSLLNQMCHIATDLQGQKVRVSPSTAFNITLQKSNNEQLHISNKLQLNLNQIEDDKSLFFLDENQNKWIQIEQEITAQLELEEAGFYLIGQAESAIYVTGNITLQNKKINKANLVILNPEQETVYETKTTSSGNWAAYLAEGELEELSVRNDCLDEIKRFGLNTNSNFDFNIENSQSTLGDLEITDCLGNRIEDDVLFTIENGSTSDHFSPNTESIVLSCHSGFEITTIDPVDNSELTTMQWDNTIDKDIKLLFACENLADNSGYLKIRENRKIYQLTLEQSSMDQTVISSLDEELKIKFLGNQMKDYADNEVNLLLEDLTFGNDGYKINCFSTTEGCGINVFEVTTYELNGKIRIYFEGEIWMQTIEPPTAGYFDIQALLSINQ